MPRKTTGMEFELYPRPTKGEDGKPLLYARPVTKQKVSMRQLDDFCNKYRGMRAGEMSRLFDCFIDVATMYMEDGYRVETPIGSFAPKLKISGDHTDPKKVTPRDVHYAGIEFIPSKQFTKELGQRIRSFRRHIAPTDTKPHADKAALDEALRKSMQRGYCTVNTFRVMAGMKYLSAKRYLEGLCEGEHPQLKKVKEGRMLLYFPIGKTKEA